MNFVGPIRDRKKIARIKNLLRGQKRYRNLLLFVVGINTALRISDLLKLQISLFWMRRNESNNVTWASQTMNFKLWRSVPVAGFAECGGSMY
jgi:hypothetical protein